MSSIIVAHYRKYEQPSGIDWAVQLTIDKLVENGHSVLVLVPEGLDFSSVVSTANDRVIYCRIPAHYFQFNNRILLLNEFENLIQREGILKILTFGAHHCGYCGALASRLQNIEHACIFNYRDVFEFHLNTPQELEIIIRDSKITATFSIPAFNHINAFTDDQSKQTLLLDLPEPADLQYYPAPSQEKNYGSNSGQASEYLLTCGTLTSFHDLAELVKRANHMLHGNHDRWVHAGLIDAPMVAPFCARLASAGLLKRLSVLGLLPRDKLISVIRSAKMILVPHGEHDTGILRRECEALGVSVDIGRERGQDIDPNGATRLIDNQPGSIERTSIRKFIEKLGL